MSSLENDTDKQLAPFLRQLADSIESGQLSPEQVQHIGEFYMSYKVINENTNNDHEEMDFIRFLTLGMYIYKFILNENNNTTTDDELNNELNKTSTVDSID